MGSRTLGSLSAIVRVGQIVTIAHVVFLALAGAGSSLLAVEPVPSSSGPLLALLGAVGVGLVSAWPILRSRILARAAARISPEELEHGELPKSCFKDLLTLVILGGAFAEAFGLAGVTVRLVTGSALGWVAVAISIVALSLVFPTRQGLEDRASQLLDDARARTQGHPSRELLVS